VHPPAPFQLFPVLASQMVDFWCGAL
jgi:hypothetical protein